ncbi:MAG: aminoacetone oxidase family FAD-binding enzyme, partial [Sphingomonadaceae bacterium]|nr:aminoacetone oxidase family FAD-binding enzyme [Sphingomonadaceae bacterium]
MAEDFDAIVLGAGAAGLMCAARAGQRGHRVLLLERAATPGKKILISGGGRCNFTNIGAGPANYLSANPHFAKSALARYTARDFLALVESHGIAWHEKTLGQLFCDGSAKQIVAMLLEECAKGEVDLRCGEEIVSVEQAGGFTVTTQSGRFRAPSLVIATGGPSIPKMGASGYAYDLARQFGLKVVEPRPALVPLTLGGEEVLFRDISGVSAAVVTSAGKGRFAEAALFTHRGLSGPAILQASSYWRPGE